MRRTNAQQLAEIKATYKHILDVATGAAEPKGAPVPSPAPPATSSLSSSSSSLSSSSLPPVANRLEARPLPLHDFDAQMALLWPEAYAEPLPPDSPEVHCMAIQRFQAVDATAHLLIKCAVSPFFQAL